VKRIAAVAALIVAMLALPAAAAMASTTASGSGHPGQSQFCPPNPFLHRHHNRHHNRHHRRHHRDHRQEQFPFINCSFPPPPPPGFCHGASFTFSWVSGASGIYEISGPALYTGQQFSFDGGLYTIVLANTLAGSMEVNAVNFGPTIFSAVANLC
jgi:hypothetical protein